MNGNDPALLKCSDLQPPEWQCKKKALSGTTPCVSIPCLPDISARDQTSHPFTLRIKYYKRSNILKVGIDPGNCLGKRLQCSYCQSWWYRKLVLQSYILKQIKISNSQVQALHPYKIIYIVFLLELFFHWVSPIQTERSILTPMALITP